jgi:nucleotide-binding universal stress UspA family protein
VIALRWACREARLRDAEVHAVHVREEPLHSPASYAVPTPEDTYGADDSEEMWKGVLAGLAPGMMVRTETAVGLVARILLDRCEGADMLVLGTANDVPEHAWSAGPVIRACLPRSPCPVVVISAELEAGWGRETAMPAVSQARQEPIPVTRQEMPLGVGA